MSKYTGYTQQQNKANQKYTKEKRDCLNLNLPKGTKDLWKAQATEKGYKSLTAYITELIEGDK